MDIDTFSNNLQSFAKVRDRVDDFFKIAEEIGAEIEAVKSLGSHIQECRKTASGLEAERKAHAEELRQINQDINILEDMSKTMKAEMENRKTKISKTIRELEMKRKTANEHLKTIDVQEFFEQSEDEKQFAEKNDQIKPLPCSPSSSTSSGVNPFAVPVLFGGVPQNPNPFAFLSSLLQAQAQAQPSTSLPSTSGPRLFPPIPNRPLPPQLINSHRMPPQFVEASKMKRCENCGANIHRNAPTCPMCKMKTKSKNPKKKRKINDQFMA